MNSFTILVAAGNRSPVVYNVENIPQARRGSPTLLTLDNVTGMFHEFGHALQRFFAGENIRRFPVRPGRVDFVEFPSQLNRHWALYPSILKHYAIHYKTHQPMPASADRQDGDRVEIQRRQLNG